MFRTVTVTFPRVSIKATKRIRCPKCKKTTQRTMEFSQTISPYNRDDDGAIKTRAQIMSENMEKRKAWLEKPLECNKCKTNPRAR